MKTPSKSPAPKWLLQRENITNRQWKQRKRTQLNAVIKAYDSYRMGCAHTPDGAGEVGRILTDLESLKQKLSVKNWGR